MNRDINDIKKEYIDLARKAVGMGLYIKPGNPEWLDYANLVRMVWSRFAYIRKVDPTWICPLEIETRKMVEPFAR